MRPSDQFGVKAFGPVYDAQLDRARLRTQMETIRELMFTASERGSWLTLEEIEELADYPQASISAQLRHLRKPQFGSCVVCKRRRGQPGNGVWEYGLKRGKGAVNGEQSALIVQG